MVFNRDSNDSTQFYNALNKNTSPSFNEKLQESLDKMRENSEFRKRAIKNQAAAGLYDKFVDSNILI